MNIADETLTGYIFLSRNHYTKSKNYLKDDIEFVTDSHVYWDTLYDMWNNHVLIEYRVTHKEWDFRADFIERIYSLLSYRNNYYDVNLWLPLLNEKYLVSIFNYKWQQVKFNNSENHIWLSFRSSFKSYSLCSGLCKLTRL